MVPFLRFIVFFSSALLSPFKRRWRDGMPIECLVVGYGGANNTGAEARTLGAIRQMHAADPRVKITLTSLDRNQTLRYIDETLRLKVAEINPVFIFSVLKLVFKSDIVVLVEGSCFKENFSAALLWFFMYSAELAQRFGIPTVTYGVDAGVLTEKNSQWARDVANCIDLLMVRTNAAAQVLRSIGVDREIIATTDTAFGIESEDMGWVETILKDNGVDLKRPVVGIAFEEFFWWPVVPRPFSAIMGVKEDRYKSIYYHSWGVDGKKKSIKMKEEIAAYADWISSKYGAQVVFVAMERLDIRPCRDVQGMMKSKSLLFDSDHANARQIAALLRRLSWLVTCRYHALVLSMEGMVPVIGLAHDERIASIMDELEFINDYFISYEEPDILTQLKEKTQILKDETHHIRRTIAAAMPRYISRMEENEKLFSALIKEKFPGNNILRSA